MFQTVLFYCIICKYISIPIGSEIKAVTKNVPKYSNKLVLNHINDNIRHQEVDSKYIPKLVLKDLKFNNEFLLRSDSRLYIDIGIVIDHGLMEEFKLQNEDIMKYFGTVFNEINKMLSWNNAEINVINFEVTNILLDVNSHNFNIDTYINEAYDNRTEKSTDFTIMFLLIPNIQYILYRRVWISKRVLLNNFQWNMFKQEKMFAEQNFRRWSFLMSGHRYDSRNCECPYSQKILCLSMSIALHYTSNMWPPKTILNCHVKQMLDNTFKYPEFFKKHKKPNIFKLCGNGVLDTDEKCDCGTELQCIYTGQQQCCDYNTCNFKDKRFQCTFGKCCENCTFVTNKVCRESYGECDIEERCNGNSFDCPPDTIYENWALCDRNKGFCFNGMCTNHNDTCRYVYNDDRIYFSQECYYHMMNIIKAHCIINMVNNQFSHLCSINDICKIYVCGSSKKLLNDDLIEYSLRGEFCILPGKNLLKGSLASAPNYVKCLKDDDYFCQDSICTNDKSKLKNCAYDICYEINNTIKYIMTKEIPVDGHGFLHINLGIYTERIKIKLPIILERTFYNIFAGMIITITTILILIISYYLYRKRYNKTIGISDAKIDTSIY